MKESEYPEELQYTKEQWNAIDRLNRTWNEQVGAHKLMEFFKKELGWSEVHTNVCLYRQKFLPLMQEEHSKSSELFDSTGAADVCCKRIDFKNK